MDRQVVMFIVGLFFLIVGCYLRIYVNVEDGMAFITTSIFLTIVWLTDSSFRFKREIKNLRKELEELKNNLPNR